jgi:hypothetical protein
VLHRCKNKNKNKTLKSMPYDVLPLWKYVIRHGFEGKKIQHEFGIAGKHLPGHTGWGRGGGARSLLYNKFYTCILCLWRQLECKAVRM